MKKRSSQPVRKRKGILHFFRRLFQWRKKAVRHYPTAGQDDHRVKDHRSPGYRKRARQETVRVAELNEGLEQRLDGNLKEKADGKTAEKLNGQNRVKALAENETWFLEQLLQIQKDKWSHPTNFRVNGSATLLVDFCEKESDSSNIHKSFMLLKKQYQEHGEDLRGLRMLELAATFGKPSEKEMRWGLAVAAREKIHSGMWLGEASMRFTSNGSDKDCRLILEEAARQGNGLSSFILKNSKHK